MVELVRFTYHCQEHVPHFVTVSMSTSGKTIVASGKEAGLGNKPQVHIVLAATAECVNSGGKRPHGSNKTRLTAAGDFPVQNGHAIFDLSATASFWPECSPPMAVRISNVSITDTTNEVRYQ
jgi:hypothetical protein